MSDVRLCPPSLAGWRFRRAAAPTTARSLGQAAGLVLGLCALCDRLCAADVLGYSVLKGQFHLQEAPDRTELDPDFAFSFLAFVNLTDFNLLTDAAVGAPDGSLVPLEAFGDSWDLLEVFDTEAALHAAYGWGDYSVDFDAVNDGSFSCPLTFAETPLPPVPRLTNFDAVRLVNPTQPLTLRWDYDAPPAAGDFVQVYVNLGHGEVFATPNAGEPGALDANARSLTIPAYTLEPGLVYSLNLEITRIAATNADCHPEATGLAGTFSSTEIALITIQRPELRLLAAPTNGRLSVEVVVDPALTVRLQGSDDLREWIDLGSSAAADGVNRFDVPAGDGGRRFFRAFVP